MTKGIKIVTPGHDISDTVPGDVVIDSRLPGSLKIHQVVRFKTSDADSTRINGFSVSIGTKVIPHNLGYSPAFICFRWGGGADYLAAGNSITLPGQGEFGESVAEQAYSSSSNVTVTGYATASSPPDVITVIIFRESLDS